MLANCCFCSGACILSSMLMRVFFSWIVSWSQSRTVDSLLGRGLTKIEHKFWILMNLLRGKLNHEEMWMFWLWSTWVKKMRSTICSLDFSHGSILAQNLFEDVLSLCCLLCDTGGIRSLSLAGVSLDPRETHEWRLSSVTCNQVGHNLSNNSANH